jgi:hypothetical protein
MPGQDAPHDIGDAKRPSKLLSDSPAAPGGIALLGGDNRINEFFGRALGTGFAPAFRGEEQAVLALSQDLVKMQESRRLQHDGRTNQAGGPHKQSAPTGDEPIREAKIGSALVGAMEDEQLMFDEDGLGNYGTDAAPRRQSGDGGDEVDKKDYEIPHFRIVARN